VAWWHSEAAHEAAGLRAWNGEGAVIVYDSWSDGWTTALLLEHCRPGTPLSATVPESDQDIVITRLLRRLWRPPIASHPFRPLAKMCATWADEFENRFEHVPHLMDAGLARAGMQLLRDLPRESSDNVLLCTDLHAENVLGAKREPWLMIDPKPYVGERTYDVLKHMLNCPERLTRDPLRFCERLADLVEIDARRLERWLFARCVQESIDNPALRDVAEQLVCCAGVNGDHAMPERPTPEADLDTALLHADIGALSALLRDNAATASMTVGGLPLLLVLLRRSTGTPAQIRYCARLLLDTGADPDSHTIEWGGEGRMSALFDAVERHDLELVRLLLDRGAHPDEDAFYHACEQSDTTFLDLLHRPGLEAMVNHKLDFEDAVGLRWFLDRGIDVNAHHCLHHAIARGRGSPIITMLLDAGADIDLPWDRWNFGRRPLALAARCGHLAAYELLVSRGAIADLDPVDTAVLAVARGESTRLPDAPPPVLGIPGCEGGYGWILGQFALLGRTEIVRALLDNGMPVDTRGWSNFTPLDQAAMHGRADTVQLLIDRGADLHDKAFDAEGPTPLDCAIWGLHNNRADDGDYIGTVQALLAAGAPTRYSDPTGDKSIDALLAAHRGDV
jgi:streptomycin 6-kinase/ankyrin repeat protein